MAAYQDRRDATQLLELLRSATAHHSGGAFDKAEEEYLRLLNHDYRKADILLLLARVVAKQGNLKAAIGHLDYDARPRSE